MRASKGMLISTEARPRAASQIKDMAESTARLSKARDVHEAEAEAAQEAGAQDKQRHQSDVAEGLRRQAQSIKGDQGGEFPELSEPFIVFSSPAGIVSTTAGSTHISSDEHTALTTGKSVSIAAGESMFASIKETFRLFVQKAGLKMIAAAGDIDVKALTDSVNILAKLNITHSANRITISAREEVLINGGGSYVKFTASGVEHGTKGDYVVHAANKNLAAARGLDALKQEAFEKSEPAKYSQQLFVDRKLWDLPTGLRPLKYQFISETMGVLGSGTLDGTGNSKPLFTDSGEDTKVVVDVNGGQWMQLVTDRHEAISLPDDSEIVVFDYDEHEETDQDADDGDENDPTLSISLVNFVTVDTNMKGTS